MMGLLGLPFALQGVLMLFDEFHFHEKRGLGLWERIGHPLDTLTVLVALTSLIIAPHPQGASGLFIGLAAFSCLFITKDEWVHTRESSAGENALHALLFVLHPVIFFCAAQLAQTPEGRLALQVQISIIACFGLYQLARWRPWQWRRSFYALTLSASAPVIETKVYETLGDHWYTAKNDPVALLRAESRARLPWIQEQLKAYHSDHSQKVLLDLGCGAGLLTNGLAAALPKAEWRLIGLDASLPALEVARKFQPQESASCSIDYQVGDAHLLPFEDQSIDCLCAMDFLEHIEDKDRVLREIARVLKPGGFFFFHTFTTGALSRFLVIDLVEAFVPNTPRGLHIEPLFIHPDSLKQKLEALGLNSIEILALNPQITPSALAHLLLKREIPDSFEFKIEDSEKITAGYIGFARRDPNPSE